MAEDRDFAVDDSAEREDEREDGDLDELDGDTLREREDEEIDVDEEDPKTFLLRFSLKGSHPSDVFADFGANSLFLLDGEALLGHCCEDHLLDKEYGGEPLHLVYLFLFYLDRLTERDARFRVVFFDSTEHLWSPQKRLIRHLIISHLRNFTKFDVDVFDSLGPAFDEYLLRYAPTNVMTKILWGSEQSEPEESGMEYDGLRALSRVFALKALNEGRSVLLMDEGINFLGPRLHVFVLFHRRNKKIASVLAKALASLPEKRAEDPSDVYASAYKQIIAEWGAFSQSQSITQIGRRLAVAWATLVAAKKANLFGEKLTSNSALLGFLCKAFVLHTVLLHYRPPLYRSFALPKQRPVSPLFEAAAEFLNALYLPLLSVVKVSKSVEGEHPLGHTETDLWDGRAFHAFLLSLIVTAKNGTVAVSQESDNLTDIAALVNLDPKNLSQLLSAISKSELSVDGFFPLSIPLSEEEVGRHVQIFKESVSLSEGAKKKADDNRVRLTWTETPEILSECIPEVLGNLSARDHYYLPEEKDQVDTWAVGANMIDYDHLSFHKYIKSFSSIDSREVYNALVHVSVALSKARDIGNDAVASRASDAASTIAKSGNRALAGEISHCVDKRNWLDLQKIVMRQIKRLDPQRLAQKQGDFINKYAVSLIGGPLQQQTIREDNEAEKAAKKEKEKEAAPVAEPVDKKAARGAKDAQAKGRGGANKIQFANKHLQELERAYDWLVKFKKEKFPKMNERLKYAALLKPVRAAWEKFSELFQSIDSHRKEIKSKLAEIEAIRAMEVRQKDLVQRRQAALTKLDQLEIYFDFVGLQWQARVVRMTQVTFPWWERFARKQKSGDEAWKSEEWAASVVLDQLLEDVEVVGKWLESAEHQAPVEAAPPAAAGKGKAPAKAAPGKKAAPAAAAPSKSPADTTEVSLMVTQTARRLGFDDLAKSISKKLQFKTKEKDAMPDVVRKMSFVEFQLHAMGPRLPRPTGQPDERTHGFYPDNWQRDLLDIVDRRESALISAPTSSGKTFISYYAMEKVLREPSDGQGVIIYVSPTKALVNQVQAEIAARFVKNYQHPGQKLCGVFTRDYRYDVENCQILVTVPECLDVILFSPQYAGWLKRIRWAIFDEVHMISKEGGEVWERLILYLDCPFLALSATVGNPTEFEHWLATVSDAKAKAKAKETGSGTHFHLIKYDQRWNDLQIAWVKAPPKSDINPITIPINPIGTLDVDVILAHGFPDIKLLPEQCLDVVNRLQKLLERVKDARLDEMKKRVASLDPNEYFAKSNRIRITLNEVVEFERQIIDVVKDVVLNFPEIGGKLVQLYKTENGHDTYDEDNVDLNPSSLLEFLKSLKNKDDEEMEILPTIVFNLNPSTCESVAVAMENYLACEQFIWELQEYCKIYKNHKITDAGPATGQSIAELAKSFLDNRQEYSAFLRKFPEIAHGLLPENFDKQDDNAKAMKANIDTLNKAKLRYYQQQVQNAAKLMAKQQQMLKSQQEQNAKEGNVNPQDNDPVEVFDVDRYQPGYVNPKFSFFGRSGAVSEALLHEHNIYAGIGVPELVQCLKRGIGVHHLDLPTKFKNAVERLFRSRHLSVIIATETLSLGINMPCRSVIFYGDHPRLDTQMYRQMSGRAGRRNFDLRGHVLFFGTPKPKVRFLLNSKLSNMTGNIPLTPMLALRMFLRYVFAQTQGKGAALDVSNAVYRILHLSFTSVVRNIENLTIPFQFLFCFEYFLRIREIEHKINTDVRQESAIAETTWEDIIEKEEQIGVSSKLMPSPTSRIMTCFFYLEPTNIYLVRLLRSGALYRLCAAFPNEDDRCIELMKVFCHIWGVLPISKTQSLVMKTSESHFIQVPPLKGEFLDLLHQHNTTALEVFSSYVLFCAQHSNKAQKEQTLLPGSSAKLFGGEEPAQSPLDQIRIPFISRSAFSALSGHGDYYTDSQDFITGARSSFEVGSSFVPTISHESENRKLNAYALDFFKTGRVDILDEYHGISRHRAYSLLKEFSSTLLGLSVTLEKRAKLPGPGKEKRELVADSLKILINSFEAKFRKAYEKW